LACFLVSWILHAWTGWRKFSAEQSQHNQVPSAFEDDDYIWDFLAATFENWQPAFLQLLAMVVLTSFLIHRSSAESKDSNDRMEAKLDAVQKRLDQLAEADGQSRRGKDKARSLMSIGCGFACVADRRERPHRMGNCDPPHRSRPRVTVVARLAALPRPGDTEKATLSEIAAALGIRA
jgi:hypothetical protein